MFSSLMLFWFTDHNRGPDRYNYGFIYLFVYVLIFIINMRHLLSKKTYSKQEPKDVKPDLSYHTAKEFYDFLLPEEKA